MTPPDQIDSQLNPNAAQLPEPTAQARAQSDALVETIGREIIRAGGAIEFDRYMDMALYEPGLGYYVAGAHKFGAGGDFVTAPELGVMFGATLANQISDVLETLDEPEASVLEFGAGTGALAAAVLVRLRELDSLPSQYLILEPSPELQQRQRERMQELPDDLLEKVRWIATLPESFSGVVVANEVLDAMPVSRYRVHGGTVSTQVVTAPDETTPVSLGLEWRELANPPRVIADLVQAHDLPDFYEIEVNSRGDAWVKAIAQMLEKGVVLLVDYGFVASEYYLPERVAGTLRCHYRHFAHDDPLFLPGLQDITCHVDFTGVASAADASGLDVLGFTSQGSFLLSCGLLDLAGEQYGEDIASNATLAKEVMMLTGPNTMGETFKVIALGRGITNDLAGFAMHDRRARL